MTKHYRQRTFYCILIAVLIFVLIEYFPNFTGDILTVLLCVVFFGGIWRLLVKFDKAFYSKLEDLFKSKKEK